MDGEGGPGLCTGVPVVPGAGAVAAPALLEENGGPIRHGRLTGSAGPSAPALPWTGRGLLRSAPAWFTEPGPDVVSPGRLSCVRACGGRAAMSIYRRKVSERAMSQTNEPTRELPFDLPSPPSALQGSALETVVPPRGTQVSSVPPTSSSWPVRPVLHPPSPESPSGYSVSGCLLGRGHGDRWLARQP